jgi:dihydrolipoamide dehydrogenase
MNDKSFDYDVIVIGGGPAGYTAASYAAQHGKRTALIERENLGGCCLNRGCIPTKILLEAANRYDSLCENPAFGVTATEASFSWNALQKYTQKTIETLRSGVHSLLKTRKVSILQGEASLQSGQSVQVDEKLLSVKNIILAVGSRPSIPEGLINNDKIVTSDTFWHLKKFPKTITIAGGGVIGCEIASALSRLGVSVSIVEQLPNILPAFEKEQTALLLNTLHKNKVKLYPGTGVSDIQDATDTVSITLANGIQLESNMLLWATGRSTNINFADAGRIGLSLTTKNSIAIDENYKTNIEGLFCIGDANGRSPLAHSAIIQAMRVVQHICTGKTLGREPVTPQCVYTSPALAKIGFSEKEAIESGYTCATGTAPYAAMGMSHATNRKTGCIKVVRDIASDKLLGAAITGEDAFELIATLLPFIEQHCTAFLDMVFPHPSLSEGLKIAIENTYTCSPQMAFPRE